MNNEEITTPSLRLQVGGTLNPRRDVYITRPEDEKLLRLLLAGEYVNVLTSRQMGKSSLMTVTMAVLREQGVRTASIDLAAELDGAREAETWFRGLLGRLARELRLDVNVGTWWGAHADDAVGQRLQRFLREVVGEQIAGSVVLFLDEIENTLKFPFTDALFTAIRGMYNERGQNSVYQRITFCLLGVATPNELIKDRRTTAYNVGQTLELRDFDRVHADLEPLVAQLPCDFGSAMLDRILYWTGGQPYLTIRLCAELLTAKATSSEAIDAHVEQTFATLDRVSNEVHFQQILRFVEGRLTDGSNSLDTYEGVLKGKRIREQTTSAHLELKLSGLVKRNADGYLVVRNLIYKRLFDAKWLRATRPRRKLAQYRKLTISAVAMSVILGLLTTYFYVANVREQEQATRLKEILEGDRAFAQGDLARAREIFERRVRNLSTKTDPPGQRDFSISLIKLADVMQAQGDLSSALRSYQQALAITESLASVDPDNTQWQRDLAFNLNNLGGVQRTQGDLTAALRSYQRARGITESLASADPDNTQWQRDLAFNLNNLGGVQRAQGDLTAALRSYQRALAITESLGSVDTDYVLSNLNLGHVQREQGDLRAALASFQEALAIADRLATAEPDTGLWQRGLLSILNSLGEVQRSQGDLTAALRTYQRALAITESLASADPDNTQGQRDLASNLNSLGEVQRAQGDLTASLRSYQQVLSILRRLASADSDNTQWQGDLASNLNNLGEVQRSQGDLTAALGSYQEALAIIERLSRVDPANVAWQRDLALSYRSVGNVQALLGAKSEALVAFQKGRGILAHLMQSTSNPTLLDDLSSFDRQIGTLEKSP